VCSVHYITYVQSRLFRVEHEHDTDWHVVVGRRYKWRTISGNSSVITAPCVVYRIRKSEFNTSSLVTIVTVLFTHYHGADVTLLAGLRHLGRFPVSFSRHWTVSLADRWSTEDHPGVHHGQPEVGYFADGDVAVRFVPVSDRHSGDHGRDVPVRSAVFNMGASCCKSCNSHDRKTYGALDLSTQTHEY